MTKPGATTPSKSPNRSTASPNRCESSNCPACRSKGDVSDWIAAGGTKEELKRLAEAAPVWTPDAQPWPEIVSFDVLDLPDFPTHVLPDVLRHGRREFSKRDAQQHGKRRFPKADDIDPALTELTRRGYIRLRPVEASGPGRPPSPTFDVNPAIFADAKPKMRSHNSHNSPGELEDGNSGNIGRLWSKPKTQTACR